MDCQSSRPAVAVQILFSLGACGESSCWCFLILAKLEQVVGCVCFAVCLVYVPTFCLMFSILSYNRFLNIYIYLYILYTYFNTSNHVQNLVNGKLRSHMTYKSYIPNAARDICHNYNQLFDSGNCESSRKKLMVGIAIQASRLVEIFEKLSSDTRSSNPRLCVCQANFSD